MHIFEVVLLSSVLAVIQLLNNLSHGLQPTYDMAPGFKPFTMVTSAVQNKGY